MQYKIQHTAAAGRSACSLADLQTMHAGTSDPRDCDSAAMHALAAQELTNVSRGELHTSSPGPIGPWA